MTRGCHKDTHLFFFLLLWHPLSDVWWLPTNRHRLSTNRHRLPTNRHRLPTNRHWLHTNRHRLPTNRHWLPTGRHRRAYWTLQVFFFSLWHPMRMTPPHDAVLKGHISKLGWMVATLVPTKRLIGAWERSLSQGPGQRPWLGVPTSSGVRTSVIPRCHQSPRGGNVRVF